MKAWLLNKIADLSTNGEPLVPTNIPAPVLHANEILIRVSCCGVCHTELDEIEGRVSAPSYPIIPAHQVVGRVEKLGTDVSQYKIGDRVGVAWIGWACGQCDQCRRGNENLCDNSGRQAVIFKGDMLNT
jgi:propanol-preferring alcohol dehydrogenase